MIYRTTILMNDLTLKKNKFTNEWSYPPFYKLLKMVTWIV